jgi:ubiquinol-cytochrome c reductase cytochrome c subunit
MLMFALPLLLAAVTPAQPSDGARLYVTYCESCHGVQKAGTPDGPSLHGVGTASVDFQLMTGRMPAAVPWIEVAHRSEAIGQALPLTQIRALEAYLAPVVAGGPEVPVVIAGSDRAHGRALYELHCMQCHAAAGTGGSIGGSDWAPDLSRATINDIADAVRAGPEQMPRFSEREIPQASLDDLAGYVNAMIAVHAEGGVPLRSTGPIPEGAVGYAAIIVLVIFVFVFWRRDTPPPLREEAVRRDEGERPS